MTITQLVTHSGRLSSDELIVSSFIPWTTAVPHATILPQPRTPALITAGGKGASSMIVGGDFDAEAGGY